jgi:hypothetical protein
MGKVDRCVGLHILSPSYLGASDSWNTQGLSRPVQGLLYLYLGMSILYECYICTSFINIYISCKWRQKSVNLQEHITTESLRYNTTNCSLLYVSVYYYLKIIKYTAVCIKCHEGL